MVLHRYRLVGLDGLPHPVLDVYYDTLETALEEARILGVPARVRHATSPVAESPWR